MHWEQQNRQLWEQVLSFDIEEYQFNYGFALRLATENNWSFSFTAAAIKEYKKFMFLAAISEEMIAPAEIIDVVWHLHLIYTDAYQSFCNVLGKEIRHVPSRKQLEEQVTFRAAWLHTQTIYTSFFGPMPDEIWKHKSMYDTLNLSVASYSVEQVKILVFALFPVLVWGLYALLKPVYRGIESSYFIPAYTILGIIIFIILGQYNEQQFKRLLNRVDPCSFLFRLSSLELIALKSGRISESVHVVTNELILNGNVIIGAHQRLSAVKIPDTEQIAETKVYEIFEQIEGPIVYDQVLYRAVHTPYFQAIQSFADHLSQYLMRSKELWRIVLLNYTLVAGLLALGVVRILSGLSAGRPVLYILFIVLFTLLMSVRLIKGLFLQFTHKVLPGHYLSSKIPVGNESAMQWGYLQSGKLALTAAFIPLVGTGMAINSDHATSSGSSCGTSCGTSCGSGCGGCGGD